MWYTMSLLKLLFVPDIIHDIVCDIMSNYLYFELSRADAADVITGREHIVKANANHHLLTATAIVDLIKNAFKIQNSMRMRLTAT
jgi:hypothetical protein